MIFLFLFSTTSYAQKYAVSTNVTELACLLTVNAEFSMKVHNNLSVHAGFEFNPFTFNKGFDNQFQNRKAAVGAHIRYWPWRANAGWFAGSGLEYGIFNSGGLFSKRTSEGWRVGANFLAGYSLLLTRKFNIEFGAGFMLGYKSYTTYACPKCGKVLGKDAGFFIAPNNVLAQLVMLF